MNGLPGRLTKRNIDIARAEGRDYIIYRHKVYTLKELEDGAGIKRAKLKPVINKIVREREVDNSNGTGSEQRGDTRKE